MSAPRLPDFVHRHLNEIAAREGFRAGFTCTEPGAGSKPGDGFSSVIRAIVLRGERGGAASDASSLALVLKLLPESRERQEVFHSRAVFEREVQFYGRILPLLRRFQADKGLLQPATGGFDAYPECYAAVADAASDEYVIIMRDLRPAGYELWDKLQPMPAENAQLLFEQLGRLTGLSLALQRQRPAEFSEAIGRIKDVYSALLKSVNVQAICQPFYEQAVELIDSPEHRKVLVEIRDTWQDVVTCCVRTTDAFSVLAHGDCWNNNMMFAGREKICLLDWQICRYVSPALDIAYFLASSTEKAMRAESYERLLRVYHENVRQVIRSCGSDPEELMTFADLQDQMRRFGRFGVAMAPMLLQIIVADSSSIGDLDAMAHELGKSDAAERKEVNFTHFNPASLERYRRRLCDVIDDAKSYGWL